MGWQALLTNSTGSNNTATGVNALQNNTEGAYNTAAGVGTLAMNESGDYNSAFGYQANMGMADLNNATAVGARAQAGHSNAVVLGSINVVKGAPVSANGGNDNTMPLREDPG